MTHAELQQVRRRLPIGSKERLLLSFHGGCIPPVRNDLHSAFIHRLMCKEGEAEDAVITPNCILSPYDIKKEGVLILREFETQDKPILSCTTEGLDKSCQTRYGLACNVIQGAFSSQRQE